MLFVKIMLVLKHSEFKTDYDQVIEVLVKTVHLLYRKKGEVLFTLECARMLTR
jgi:hypothetical protein